jgi:hypothetical protein
MEVGMHCIFGHRTVNNPPAVPATGAARSGFMPYTKLAPERLQAGHKGELSYLLGKKVKARIVQVRGFRQQVDRRLLLQIRDNASGCCGFVAAKSPQLMRAIVCCFSKFPRILTVCSLCTNRILQGLHGICAAV